MVIKNIFRGQKGFTLIELLVVIAIIGLLSTLAIVALGTARQKSRDAKRLADMRQIQTALELYNNNTGSYPIASSTIVLGDADHACLGTSGFNSVGSCTNQLLVVPKDPGNGSYTYSSQNGADYIISATLEGTVNDLSGTVAATSNKGASKVAAPPFTCGSPISYGGQSYDTVQIGTQCWFAQNINVGTMLATGPTNPILGDGTIQKWCYSNATSSCDVYGGLYTWAEANQLGSGCDAGGCSVPADNQGICPSGWHVPSDQEYMTLEEYLGMCSGTGTYPNFCSGDVGEWRGTDQGTQLKVGGGSGFETLMAGGRDPFGNYFNSPSYGYLWTSSEWSATAGWKRYFLSTVPRVYRDNDFYSKTYGFSVRCLIN